MSNDTVRFSLLVRTGAVIEEVWELNLPADASEDDAMDALANPGTDTVFVSEHSIGGEEDREFVSMEQVPAPVEEPDYWNDFPDLLQDWRYEVYNGDTLRGFPEYVAHRAELDSDDQA